MVRVGRLLFFTLVLVLPGHAHSHEMPGGLLIHLPFDGSLANHGSMPASAQLIIAGGEPAGRSPEFREGRFGKAMYFPGDVAVRIPVDIGHELYPEITLTAWVYLEDSASGYVITNRSASGPSIRVSGSYVAAIGPRVEFNENVGTGRWTFVAGVWDRNTSTLRFHYGRRSGTRDMTDRKVAGQISTWVGAWDDTLQSVLTNALVDDVRVYDSALTPEQIEGLWLGTEVAASKTQSITSDEMVVRKKPGRTITDGERLQSGELSQPGQPQYDGALVEPSMQDSVIVGNSASLEEAARTQQLREQQGTELDSNAGSMEAGSLTGSTPTTSEIVENYDSQVDTTGSALSGGSSELERIKREGGDSTTSGASSSSGAASTSTTGVEPDEEPASRQQTGWKLSETDIRRSAVSGLSANGLNGGIVSDADLGTSGRFKELTIKERNNVPCRVNAASKSTNRSAHSCREGRELFSFAVSNYSVDLSDAHIGGLKVCTNPVNGRVKGVEIRGDVINGDGTTGLFQKDSKQLPNCSAWQTLVLCDSGYAGSGIVGHFRDRPNAENEELVGLQLICRKIEKTYE